MYKSKISHLTSAINSSVPPNFAGMETDLPILEIIPELKTKLLSHNTIILQAPPGAGKSTVLPLELLNESWLQGQKILMLEPRRLATRAVANRMASLYNDENVGETIGYRIRFDNKISSKTRIEVLTEGILTRMLQQDNALEGVGLVIFDEFHERSLHADIALALCRESQQVLREDLKILIMSATLDGEKLSSLMGNAPILTSKGRQYPVEIKYTPQEEHLPIYIQVTKAIKKALREEEGDLLVFLPGAGEIHRTADLLEQEINNYLKIYPLYGDLPQREQQAAIMSDPQGRRKVVLATSIAETSLTIEGIKVVIDSGYSRVSRFDPRTGLTKLETVKVTKDAADQRAGRAGRTSPGVAYRLWSEGANHHLIDHRKPEILEADLAPMVLELANWGAKDIRSLTWLTPPPAGALAQAETLLRQLEALDEYNRITEKGKEMLRLPTHPRLAHMLLEGKENVLLPLATDIAALLEERDPLPKEAGTDLSLRVETLRKWRNKQHINAERALLERIEKLAANWRKLFRTDMQNTMPAEVEVGQLIAAAYPERIAKLADQPGRYRLANGRVARLQEHDPLAKEKWLAVAQLDAGTKEGRIYLAAPLNPTDVLHLAQENDVLTWDSRQGVLLVQRELRLGNITVESKPLEKIPEEARIKVICEAIRSEGENLLNFTESIEAWQSRVLSLRKWRPAENWPDISKEYLLATPEEWLAPYLSNTNIRKREDFKKLDLYNILQGLLPWPLPLHLDELAPATIQVPSGSQIKLQYSPDGSAPVLAVRLQEMFGLLDTPTVNEGRTKVLLHLLSPGYKPVQVTQDLRSFWQNTYPEVRKELRVRYQKHSWPEDPWTAEAVRGAKRRRE